MAITRPIVSVGQYFKIGEDLHMVTHFEGFLIDETGKRHPLSQCQGQYWDEQEIKEAQERAKELYDLLSEDTNVNGQQT